MERMSVEREVALDLLSGPDWVVMAEIPPEDGEFWLGEWTEAGHRTGLALYWDSDDGQNETFLGWAEEYPSLIKSLLQGGESLENVGALVPLPIDEDEDGHPVLRLPGFEAYDGYAEILYEEEEGREEVAAEWVSTGEWGERDQTILVEFYTARRGIDAAGELTYYDVEHHHETLDPIAPDCSEEEHDWVAPYEVLGGCRENPGVWGNGGGIISRGFCRYCGVYEVTDTWAEDGSGSHMTSTRFESADELSLAWVEAHQEADEDE